MSSSVAPLLKSRRKDLGLSVREVLSKLHEHGIDVSDKTLYGWENGHRQPDADTFLVLCQIYEIGSLSTIQKVTSGLSDEAQRIAKSYEKLTDHGKGAVKAILGYEEKALVHHIQQEDEDGKIIAMPTSKRNGHGFIEIRVYEQPAAAGLGNYLDEPDYRTEQYPPKVIPSKTDFGVIISGDSMEPKIHDGGTVFVQSIPAIDPGQIGIFILDGKAYCKKLAVDQDNRQIRLVSLNPNYHDILVGEDDSFRTLGRVLGQWTPGYKQDLLGW